VSVFTCSTFRFRVVLGTISYADLASSKMSVIVLFCFIYIVFIFVLYFGLGSLGKLANSHYSL